MDRSTNERGGVVLIDKSAGPTSHDVVTAVRKALGTRRVGHTGTLDPFATGLLLACVGRTTRLQEYFHLLSKTYQATLRLGAETDTDDCTGEIVARSDDWRELNGARLREALSEFVGSMWQLPPVYSAKKVEGRRAYEMARVGQSPELAPVEIQVHDLRILHFQLPDLYVEATVSTGTYVRALARDLGRSLGCGAHLTALRRTRIGPFLVSESLPDVKLPSLANLEWDPVKERWWYSPAEALAWMPGRELEPGEAFRVREGRRIPTGVLRSPTGPETESLASATSVRSVALLEDNCLVAVAEVKGSELQPRKVFADA